MDATDTGDLLLIVGPPAVGKMTVGRALCELTGRRLLTNHHTIEPLLEIFGHGTPPFEVLNTEFRRRVVEEAAAGGLRLVFTVVWYVEDPADAGQVRSLVAPYVERGRPVRVVELSADLDTRLERNAGASRLAAKPSKRDLAWSQAHVREVDAIRTGTSSTHPTPADAVLAEITGPGGHLRLDTTQLSAEEAAARIAAWLA